MQTTTEANSRGGCHKVPGCYSSSLTQQLPAFLFHSVTHTHTHTHTHTNRIKSPDAQRPHSWQVRNNQSKGSQRQSVTISVTAGEVTNDTERGRKGKTENTDAKLYGT